MTTQWQSHINSRAAIPWAIYLGANTAKRLAAEWSIPERRAGAYLAEARASGMLRAHWDGYHLRYGLRKLLPGMVAKMERPTKKP